MVSKKNIIIVSNEAWGDIWYSKHHYAFELSKTEEVVFINPPGKWSFLNLFLRGISITKVYPHLSVLTYRNFLPSYFFKWNNRVISARIKKFLSKTGFHADLFWTFDPYRLHEPKRLGAGKSLFHVVDRYLFIHPAEVILNKNVDAFVFVAEEFKGLYEQYKKPSLVIPHGVLTDKNEYSEVAVHEIPYENYFLYMGMIDERLDYPLIVGLVKKFDKEIFVFLGDFKKVNHPDFKKLFIDKEFHNVIHIPGVHALKLNFYLARSKACLAPMWDGWAGNMISHHKVLQYLAHGKAVFSPVFSAYESFSDLLYMEKNADSLIDRMDSFLKEGEPDSLAVRRIQFAEKLTYRSHVSEILNFIFKG